MSTLLNRRQFSLSSLALFVAGCSSGTDPHETGNIILGGGSYQDLDTGTLKHVLSIVDLKTHARHSTETSFRPHGVHRKQTDPNCLAVFEKKGPGACEFDLNSRTVVRYIQATKNRWFYGHGAYSLDGAVLYSTETVLDSKDGAIAIRDSSDMQVLSEFPSYGKEPHECKIIDSGKTLVVTNGGGELHGDPPSICYIDIASERLIEKIELSNARLNTGHFAVSSSGDLVVISAPRSGLDKRQPGGISIRAGGSAMHSISDPEHVTRRMFGEALSVIIHERSGIVAVTHPDGNMVTFWSLRNRDLLNVLEIERPRGVELTVDGTNFIVSYGDSASLVRVPVDTLTPDKSSIIDSSYITGSHIYNWSRKI